MITITMNDDFTLNCDTNIIPAQHSANIPFRFEVPEAYENALVVPGYIYYDGERKIESAIDNYENGDFSITNGFVNDGMLGISFALTNGKITETTAIIEFEVRRSVNTSFSLPEKTVWQNMLQNFMEQYMTKVYSSIIEDLIQKEQDHYQSTEQLQSKVNSLIKSLEQLVNDVNDKLESGELKGEAGKSILYGEGVPTDEIGNVGDMYINTSNDEPYPFYAFFKTNEGWMPSIKMQGVDGTDTLPIEAHVFYPEDMPLPEGYEADECTLPADIIECNNGLNVEQMFNRPKQLLINNDFQINQRGKAEYTFKAGGFQCHLDMWCINISALPCDTLIKPIKGGGVWFTGARNIIQFTEKLDRGKKYCISAKIDGIVRSMVFESEDEIIQNDYFEFNGEFNEYKDLICIKYQDEVNGTEVEYVDLWEGDIVYPHVKEDCAIALQECQNRVIVYNELTLPCDFSYIDKDYDSIIANLYLPTNFKGQPNISYDTNEIGNYHDLIKYTDFSIWSKKLYGANIIRIVWKKDSGTFHDTIKDAYVYMKNLVISCEETL